MTSRTPLHSQVRFPASRAAVLEGGVAGGDHEEAEAAVLALHPQEGAHLVAVARGGVPGAPVAREARHGARLVVSGCRSYSGCIGRSPVGACSTGMFYL